MTLLVIDQIQCGVYDGLKPRWEAAVAEEERLRAATVELLRSMGRRKVIDTRIEARHTLAAIEAEINAHITGCPLCRAAKRSKLNVAKVQPY